MCDFIGEFRLELGKGRRTVCCCVVVHLFNSFLAATGTAAAAMNINC
jgi:hypothetical protein